jgi:two-component system, LytTR family, sensor kinase
MNPRFARALIVLAVFALMAVLAATESYVTRIGRAPDPPPAPSAAAGPADAGSTAPARKSPNQPPLHLVFLNQLRLYVAWALVTPGVLYLARRIPPARRPRTRAVLFHALVPVAGSLPFFFLRFLVNRAFGVPFPSWAVLTVVPWGRVWVLQAAAALPVYWLLVGLSTLVQLSRAYEANRLAEIDLRHSLVVAQHDALKMKLQPHFLFNALNAVAALARAGETGAVIRVVEQLGTLLRLSMETSARQFVTLEQELALVDAYLAIEEIRRGDRLHVVRRIEPAVRHAVVPNLILQPLVENALVHGLSRRLDASLLEVAARRDGGLLRIAVRDDGPGLPAAWSLGAHAGAGLKNVGDRIRGLFPADGGFAVENGATGGAVALLWFPFADAETTAISLERPAWTA